jgi:hypothetical protein
MVVVLDSLGSSATFDEVSKTLKRWLKFLVKQKNCEPPAIMRIQAKVNDISQFPPHTEPQLPHRFLVSKTHTTVGYLFYTLSGSFSQTLPSSVSISR